jgi:hypothetical protein
MSFGMAGVVSSLSHTGNFGTDFGSAIETEGGPYGTRHDLWCLFDGPHLVLYTPRSLSLLDEGE